MLPIAEALHLNAARQPRRPAIVTADRTIDYATFADRVARLATGLQAAKGSGGRVGVLVGNRPEHFEVLFALARLGGCAVPMDTRWAPPELAMALRQFAPTLVVVEPELLEPLRAACAEAGANPLVVALGPAYEELLAGRPTWKPDDVGPEADYLVAPTGGTTSRVKGALISYRATVMRFLVQAVELGFRPGDVYLSLTPMFHGGARSFGMGHLYYGGSIVLPGRISPDRYAETVARYGVTTMFLVPTMLGDLLAAGTRLHDRFRTLISSGSRLEPALRERLMAEVTGGLYNYFASVEAGGVALARPEDPRHTWQTVGRPLWGSELLLLDERGAPVPRGEEGRVAVRGPATSHGYDGDPVAHAATFADGLVLTGDLARLDEDGYLTLAGRATDMIVSGGINVYPTEVEEALLSHPGVAAVAVLGLPDPRWGEAVTAVVVPKADARPTAEELVRLASERLAAYKKPKRVLFRDSLPLSSMGKVVKRQLREELLADEGRTA
jgi:acyl-CoA synthetase (AMP-forming)/AMP-acid ligase II